MSSFSKSQIFSKKAKIQTLHATINILSSLALTQVSGRSPHCSESFLLFVLFSSLFPEQVKVLPDSISLSSAFENLLATAQLKRHFIHESPLTEHVLA